MHNILSRLFRHKRATKKNQKPDRNLLPKKGFFRRHKKAWLITCITLALLGILATVLYLITIPHVTNIKKDAQAAKTKLELGQKKLTAQDFSGSKQAISESQQSFQSVESEFEKLQWLEWIPYVRTQYIAAKDAIDGASHVYTGMLQLLDVSETIFAPIQKNSTNSIKQISLSDKREILGGLAIAEPALANIETEFMLANDAIDRIPEKGILPQVKNVIKPIQDNVPKLSQTIKQILPISRILPSFLGYEKEQQYLLLFQNNTELRPTGGFIGTYGIFKIKNGEIVSLVSDNVYNLDEPANKAGLRIDPPAPLFQYNKVDKLFLRDSNWSPDFPTSAQKAIELYTKEGGKEKALDGVIAIDPTLIASLLGVTGPITVRGVEFTKDNFVAKLQDHVSQGYKYAGLESADRKDIIGDLGKELINKLFALPKNRWQELFVAFESSLTEKHLLLWLTDEKPQSVLSAYGWDGHIPSFTPNTLQLFVVDANLASLKTDPAVLRTNDISITQTDSTHLQMQLKRSYANTGKLTWKTTRYRTFTRIYLPKGTTLGEHSGQMIDCKIEKAGNVDAYEEFGHAVFTYFACIEPGETHDLNFTFTVPIENLSDVQKLIISLIKQPGTPGDRVSLHGEFANTIKRIEPIDGSTHIDHTQFSLQSMLDRDLRYTISF